MIQEMERVIHKRDTIQLKYEPKASADPNAAIQVKRQVASLRSNLTLCTQAAQETEQRTRQREEEAKDVQQNLEQATLETGELERSVEEAVLEAAMREVQKARLAGELSRNAREAQRLEEVAADGVGIPGARPGAARTGDRGPGPAQARRGRPQRSRRGVPGSGDIVRRFQDVALVYRPARGGRIAGSVFPDRSALARGVPFPRVWRLRPPRVLPRRLHLSRPRAFFSASVATPPRFARGGDARPPSGFDARGSLSARRAHPSGGARVRRVRGLQ